MICCDSCELVDRLWISLWQLAGTHSSPQLRGRNPRRSGLGSESGVITSQLLHQPDYNRETTQALFFSVTIFFGSCASFPSSVTLLFLLLFLPPLPSVFRCFRSRGGLRANDEQTLSASILEQRPALTGNIIYLSRWM